MGFIATTPKLSIAEAARLSYDYNTYPAIRYPTDGGSKSLLTAYPLDRYDYFVDMAGVGAKLTSKTVSQLGDWIVLYFLRN